MTAPAGSNRPVGRQGGADDRLAWPLRISKTMRPFVERMRLRAKDLDLSDAAAAAQFEGSIEEMRRILAKAQIPVAKINRAIDQTLDAATDHKLQSMRVSDRVWHRSRSASDVETLIQRLTQLAKAIAKLPPSARGRLNEIVARYSEQFFDTEIFVSLIHDVAATLPNLAPRNLREMHWTSLISR